MSLFMSNCLIAGNHMSRLLDAFEIHCLSVDYKVNNLLNANTVQMDVTTAIDTGGC